MKKLLFTLSIILSGTTFGQKYLIEYYAGHQCPNCPSALDALLQAKAMYGDDLIFTTIHAAPTPSGTSGFQETNPEYPNDLTNSSGLTYGSYFVDYGFLGNPMFASNRVDFGTDEIIFLTSQLDDRIANTPALASEFDLSINPLTNLSSDSLSFSITMDIIQTPPGSYSLVLYVIEDSIVSAQNVTGTNDPNYVHRNVHRKTLIDPWGVHKFDASTPVGTISENHTFYIDPSWDPEQVSIIAYIYDESDKEIRELAKMDIGVLDLPEENEISFGLYPNPTSGNVQMNVLQSGSISILNSLGQVLINKQVSIGNNNIQTSTLSKGTYIVQFKTQDNKISNKQLVIK